MLPVAVSLRPFPAPLALFPLPTPFPSRHLPQFERLHRVQTRLRAGARHPRVGLRPHQGQHADAVSRATPPGAAQPAPWGGRRLAQPLAGIWGGETLLGSTQNCWGFALLELLGGVRFALMELLDFFFFFCPWNCWGDFFYSQNWGGVCDMCVRS